MPTNIVLDDELVKEAFNYAGVTTKRELIAIALQEYIENHKRLDVRELRGKIKIHDDYDYKKLRTAEGN